MKKLVLSCTAVAGLVASSAAMAETRIVSGPEPIETYAVCNHDALFAINDRAKLLKSGGRSFTDNGSTFVVGYTPAIYLETKHLVRHAFRSLSATGVCE